MTTSQLDKTENQTKRVLTFKVNSQELIAGLKAVQQAAQTATKIEWNAINFALNAEGVKLSSLDGFRISTYQMFLHDRLEDDQFRISLEATKELISRLKSQNCVVDIRAEISATVYSQPSREVYTVSFSWGNGEEVHSVLTDLVGYPNLENAIPKTFSSRVLLDRKVFLSGVKHLSACSGADFTKIIFLSFIKDETGGDDHKVELSLKGGIVSASFRAIGIGGDGIGGDGFKIILRSQFLLDPLKNLTSDRIFLEVNSATSPVAITTPDDKYLGVVMPLTPTKTA
jgi:DNA polymerase III subunit beta